MKARTAECSEKYASSGGRRESGGEAETGAAQSVRQMRARRCPSVFVRFQQNRGGLAWFKSHLVQIQLRSSPIHLNPPDQRSNRTSLKESAFVAGNIMQPGGIHAHVCVRSSDERRKKDGLFLLFTKSLKRTKKAFFNEGFFSLIGGIDGNLYQL